MKIKFCLVLLFHIPLLCHSLNLDQLTISAGDPNALNTGGSNEIEADKRSGGSFGFISSLKSGLLSSLGRASASFASGSSGGSSGGGYKSTEVHANSVDFDPWSLKKSVLNTIFQAVKAITGGVTALKGQLIKGSGYAISAGGKLIAASGDKVTDVGKGIISSAQLSPPNPHPAPHPFANKFSGLASLSGASSALSSSSHDTRFETNVPSSESITSFDIPTGHANYGAPAKAPSYTATVTKYIPTGTYTSGAGGHTSGSGGQFTAAAYEGPHISGITYPKYGLPGEAPHSPQSEHEHDQHNHHHYDHYYPFKEHKDIEPSSNQNAHYEYHHDHHHHIPENDHYDSSHESHNDHILGYNYSTGEDIKHVHHSISSHMTNGMHSSVNSHYDHSTGGDLHDHHEFANDHHQQDHPNHYNLATSSNSGYDNSHYHNQDTKHDHDPKHTQSVHDEYDHSLELLPQNSIGDWRNIQHSGWKEHDHSTNTQSQWDEPHDNYSPHLGTGHIGTSTSYRKGTAEVLKEIMPFIQKTKQNTNSQTGHVTKLVEQYEIPSDPKPFEHYSLPGPIQSISHTQSITTAFGQPLNKPEIDNTINLPASAGNDPYDIYHSMSAKYAAKKPSKDIGWTEAQPYIAQPPNPTLDVSLSHKPKYSSNTYITEVLPSVSLPVKPSPHFSRYRSPNLHIGEIIAALEARSDKNVVKAKRHIGYPHFKNYVYRRPYPGPFYRRLKQ